MSHLSTCSVSLLPVLGCLPVRMPRGFKSSYLHLSLSSLTVSVSFSTNRQRRPGGLPHKHASKRRLQKKWEVWVRVRRPIRFGSVQGRRRDTERGKRSRFLAVASFLALPFGSSLPGTAKDDVFIGKGGGFPRYGRSEVDEGCTSA